MSAITPLMTLVALAATSMTTRNQLVIDLKDETDVEYVISKFAGHTTTRLALMPDDKLVISEFGGSMSDGAIEIIKIFEVGDKLGIVAESRLVDYEFTTTGASANFVWLLLHFVKETTNECLLKAIVDDELSRETFQFDGHDVGFEKISVGEQTVNDIQVTGEKVYLLNGDEVYGPFDNDTVKQIFEGSYTSFQDDPVYTGRELMALVRTGDKYDFAVLTKDLRRYNVVDGKVANPDGVDITDGQVTNLLIPSGNGWKVIQHGRIEAIDTGNSVEAWNLQTDMTTVPKEIIEDAGANQSAA